MRAFFKTVAIVTVFSICEKFLGFLYRVYLSHSIGAEGIGIYQVALSVFSLLLTISCSGTPITVSRLMTKYRAEKKYDKANSIISAGITVTLCFAIPLFIVFFIFAPKLTFIFADPRCISVFKVVLPGLIFTSVYAVLRGVFWGDKDFLPYSIIELLEEACMIIVGVILITFASDVYDGAFRAGVAVLISYVFSFALAVVVFFLRRHKLKNPRGEFKPLLASAMPVTAMRTANSLAVSMVSIILPLRLVAAGYTNAEAMSSFGAAVGQAIPLLFIPTTLIGSFTLVLVPEISENYYKKRSYYLKRDVEKALKFCIFLTSLFIPVFFVCGKEIGILVFNGHECGTYLTASAFLMLFMSLSSITTSMLNSMGLEHKTLVYYIISGIFMLLCIWFLPKVCGIYSLLIGFSFIYGLTSILNLVLLNKNCAEKPKYVKFLIWSIFLLVPTAILGLMLKKLLLSVLGTFITFLVCSFVMIIFNASLYFGFNLLSVDLIKRKFKINKPKAKQLSFGKIANKN